MRKISWLGIAILLLGCLLLIQNLNLLPFDLDFGIILPALLMVFAVSSMVDSRRISVFGVLLSFVSVYWLLYELGVNVPHIRGLLMPLLLIAIGASILLPALTHRNSMRNNVSDFSSFSFFGGDDRTLGGDVFTGGSVTSIFGGSNLRLLGYQHFAPNASLYFTILFGGSDIYVPRNIRVERGNLVCMFGGMEIKGTPFPDADQTLTLNGLVMFGGLDIYYLD